MLHGLLTRAGKRRSKGSGKPTRQSVCSRRLTCASRDRPNQFFCICRGSRSVVASSHLNSRFGYGTEGGILGSKDCFARGCHGRKCPVYNMSAVLTVYLGALVVQLCRSWRQCGALVWSPGFGSWPGARSVPHFVCPMLPSATASDCSSRPRQTCASTVRKKADIKS